MQKDPAILSLTDLATLIILTAAAFAHGALGFGFPLLATPLLALVMDLRMAILLTLIPTILINLVSIAHERHWREALRRFWPLPVSTMIGSLISTQLLLSIDPQPFQILLALVLVAFLLLERRRGTGPERQVPHWALALLGLSMGLLAGLINIFAPVVVAFALYTRMNPALMVATFNLSFITSKSGQVLGFASRDALDPEVLGLALILLPAVLLALWIGIRVRRRHGGASYRNWLRGALWAIAVLLIIEAW
ncbi:hypothetical protein MARPU_01225 [Marichromatium purpuratum 984]|uniref:Probable membrane transporter protein n=1 Tax=Marichromatium purpuratum 984 TaxID=765910 RepID=W0DZC8_MARPU|nr:sulfite exporter TauE/SafE family protein [Marichromatium purpuratum]AHF02633.1 hypothetical protein MARPU_01225 [Marichromatium purpuratum 984]